jgi:hypothetical protein
MSDFIGRLRQEHEQVFKMWRSIGVTCLQVADGDF